MTTFSSVIVDCKCGKDNCYWCHECGPRPLSGCKDCGQNCKDCPRRATCYCND